jgi:hypothetical protein
VDGGSVSDVYEVGSWVEGRLVFSPRVGFVCEIVFYIGVGKGECLWSVTPCFELLTCRG